jgi:hypothetical protein
MYVIEIFKCGLREAGEQEMSIFLTTWLRTVGHLWWQQHTLFIYVETHTR